MHSIEKYIAFCVIVTIIFLSGTPGMAQFADDAQYDEAYIIKFEEAMSYVAEGNYKSALPILLELEQKEPVNANLKFHIGICYLNSAYEKNLAIPYLEKASKNITIDYFEQDFTETSAPAFAYYFLAKAYHINYQFDEAIDLFNKFKYYLNIKDKDIIDETNHLIAMCYNAKKLTAAPVNVQTENLGKSINTEFPEYSPVIAPDESFMIFTSRREETTGGEKDWNGQFFEDLYIAQYDKKKNSWKKVENMGSNINTPGHEASVSISHDGNKLFIYKADNETGNVYMSEREGKDWSVPRKIKEISSKAWETHACLSPDEKTLFFVSDRKKGLGGRDIYICSKQGDGEWSKPKNMGPQINTQWDEESPFMLSDNKTLYFSSQGHESMGGFDIFYSVLGEDGNWSNPKNIGYPVNTADDDLFYNPVGTGKEAYYSSVKAGGLGDKDIYKVKILETKDMYASFTGKVVDSITNEGIETVINIIKADTKEIFASTVSNPKDGEYHFSLPIGNSFIVEINDMNYLSFSKQIKIAPDASNAKVHGVLKLKPAPVSAGKILLDDKEIVIGERVILDKIFFNTNEATITNESNKAITELYFFLFDNPSLKIEISGHTDNQGDEQHNLALSEARAKRIADTLLHGGVDENRVVFKGYGSSLPIASNDTDEGRAANRRVEFKVIQKYSGVSPFYVISSRPKVEKTELNIKYSVQISSAKDSARADELKAQYALDQEVYVHGHAGNWKYSAGMFDTYREASEYSKMLREEKQINSFTIAFKDKERISIHEARIITKEN